MSRQLRDYQEQAVRAAQQRAADGDLALAGMAATGLGKSTILAERLARHLRAHPDQRGLMVAHRTELCDQLGETWCKVAPDLGPPGRVQGSRNGVAHRLVVATVDTLRAVKRGSDPDAPTLPRLDALTRPDLPPVGIVGYDEFHHAAARANRRVLQHLGAAGEAATIPLLGVSATLSRSDRYGLGELVHQREAFRFDTRFGIDNGYLVRPRGKVVVADHLDLKRAKVTAGDYQDGQLGEMVEQDAEQIVQAWLDRAENRITVGFFPTVDSATAMLEAFQARGVAAELVTGKTPTGDGMFARGSAERGTGIYGRLAQGRTRVLVGVMVTTEGWDCPPASCVLVGRPTRSETLYAQMVGRVLRPVTPELAKAMGWELPPPDALVLDVVGASRGQKLVSLIDLVHDADVDLSALEAIPCDECHRKACICGGPAEPGPERVRNLLQGPAFYEDFDLLVNESGRWLATDAGHPVLAPDGFARFAVILQEPGGLYRVGTVTRRGRPAPERLGQPGLTLDQARRVAEDWAVQLAPRLGHRNGAWRTGSSAQPSGKQWWKAKRLGCSDPDGYTAAELADWIAVREASMRMDILGQGAAAKRAGAG